MKNLFFWVFICCLYSVALFQSSLAWADGTNDYEGNGSAFAIGERLLITNHHVVTAGKEMAIYSEELDAHQFFRCETVATDPVNDLAVIRVIDERFPGFKSIPYGLRADVAQTGEEIFVMGYPIAYQLGVEVKLTTGILSARSGLLGNVAHYQISAPVNGGNSGGPVFDKKGNIIGITTSKYPEGENVSYAVKSSVLNNLLLTKKIETHCAPIDSIQSLSLAEKSKRISPYVVMVAIYGSKEEQTPATIAHDRKNNFSEKDAQNATDFYEYALEMFAQREYAVAHRYIREAVRLYPSCAILSFNALLDVNYLGNYQEGVSLLKECLQYGCYNDENAKLLLFSYLKMGNYQEGISLADKLLAKNRRDLDALVLKGNCLARSGDLFSGSALFEEAIRYDGIVPDDDTRCSYGELYAMAADCYLLMGEAYVPKAKGYIEEAVKRNGRNSLVWDVYASYLYRIHEHRAAIEAANNAISCGKYNQGDLLPSSYHTRGLAYQALGNDLNASRDLKEAIRMRGDTPDRLLLQSSATNLEKRESENFSIIQKKVKANRLLSNNYEITAIERSNESTILYLTLKNPSERKILFNIQPTCYLRDAKNKQIYPILAVENSLWAPKTGYLLPRQTLDFALIFPALPRDTHKIDLIEAKRSDLRFYGIRLDPK